MFLTWGCNDEVQPSNLIDTVTLVDFISEAQLIESYVYTSSSMNRDSLDIIVDGAYDSLFAKYGITYDDFTSTMDYYSNHPQQLERIFIQVMDRLSTIK